MRGERAEQSPIALWVHSLRPWEDFATMTFRPRGGCGTGRYAATVHFREFMDRHCRGVSWFGAFERNPGFPGFHVHAVFHALRRQRSEVWRLWFDLHGRNKIEPIQGKGDVVSYCAKYVTKGFDTWWDFRLHPVRSDLVPHERIAGAAGKLV